MVSVISNAKNASHSIFLTLCVMGFFAILSSTMSKNPVLSPFATSLGTPADMTGFVAAASTIPGILVSLPAASLSDIFGRRRFLLLAGFVFASAPFFYLLITVWWQLILVRFYHGFATAIFVPVAEASVAELSPDKRGERISLFSSATYVGRGIAPFLGGAILFLTNDSYNTLYLAVGVAGVTAFVMALLFLVERKQPIVRHREDSRDVFRRLYQGWGTIIRNGVVLMASFIQASLYYTYGAVEFYLAGYLKTDLGFNSLLTSIVTGSLIVMPIFVRPYMGRLSDRVGRRAPIVAGLVVSGFSLLLIPFVNEFLVLLLLTLVYGLGFATVTASTPALVSELVPAECIGASMGFLDMTMDIGQTVGSMISGFILATSLRYYGVFPSLGIVLLAASIVFAVSRVAKKRKNESLS